MASWILPAIGIGLSLLGRKKKTVPQTEWVDPYQGKASERRDELWNLILGAHQEPAPLYDEARDIYRTLPGMDISPEAQTYLADVLSGKYEDVTRNPVYRRATEAIERSYGRTINRSIGQLMGRQALSGGGSGYGVAREAILRQALPELADKLALLDMQRQQAEIERRNRALIEEGLRLARRGELATSAAGGLAGIESDRGRLAVALLGLLGGILPTYAKQAGAAPVQVPSTLAQIGQALINLWGVQSSIKANKSQPQYIILSSGKGTNQSVYFDETRKGIPSTIGEAPIDEITTTV